MDSKGITEVW